MKIKEINDLLPREQEEDLTSLLTKFSSLIDDAVNFGTHLMKWDADKKRAGDENLPPLLFLRNILELSDAISILVRNSSIDPCKILLRSLLENVFGLEYLLENETEKRSLAYIVWHTHKDLKVYEKLNSSTPTGKQFKKEIEKDKLVQNANNYFDGPKLSAAKQNAEDMLRLPKYVPIENEYQLTNKRVKNPHWYSLFNGPYNVEKLAKHLNLHASYEILYRNYSGNVHSTSIFQKKLVPNSDGTVAIIQIRYPEDAQSITQNTLNLLLLAYLIYFKERVPEKNQDFKNWYNQFRTPYQELATKEFIKIKYGSRDATWLKPFDNLPRTTTFPNFLFVSRSPWKIVGRN